MSAIAKSGVYPYALQMALKLYVAKLVDTAFYVTLDSDLILLNSFSYEDIIFNDDIADAQGKMKHMYILDRNNVSIYFNVYRIVYLNV